MKILFLINCLSYGGAEKNLKIIANHLSDLGNEVQVCTLNYRPTTNSFNNNNIKVIELSKRQGFFLNVLRLKYYDLKNVVMIEKPDVIVSFLGYANVLNVIVGKSCGIPSVISERADPYLKSSSWMGNMLTRFFQWIYTFADGAVFQTPMAKEFFAKRLQKRSVVIPNPVVLPESVPSHDYENAEKRIVFVGRFELKQKRQDIALKAFKIILEKHPDYSLSFYGDGEDEIKVRDLVKDMKLEDKITFNSVSKNILDDISTAEIFILTSDYEGIPNSLIEALSIGMPCVATDCSPGGARVLIDHNQNGQIVSCGDCQGIANAVCYYIENPSKAKCHGMKAMDIKSRYSLEVIMGKWTKYIYSFKKQTAHE